MTSSSCDKKSVSKTSRRRRTFRNEVDNSENKKKAAVLENDKDDQLPNETKKKKKKLSSYMKQQESKWEAARRKRFNTVLESLRLELPNPDPCPKIEIAQRALAFVKALKNSSEDPYDAKEHIEKIENENAILTYILKEAGVTFQFNKKRVIYFISKCSPNCKSEKKKFVLNLLSAHSKKLKNSLNDNSAFVNSSDKYAQTDTLLCQENKNNNVDSQQKKIDVDAANKNISGNLTSESFSKFLNLCSWQNVPSHAEANPDKKDNIIIKGGDKNGLVSVSVLSKVDRIKAVEPTSTILTGSELSPYKLSLTKATKAHTLDSCSNQTIYVHDLRRMIAQQPKSFLLPTTNKMILLKCKNKDNLLSDATNLLVPTLTEPHLTIVTPSLSNSPIMSTGLASSPKKTIIQVDSRYPFVINSATSNTSFSRLKRIAPKPAVKQENKKNSIDVKSSSISKKSNSCLKFSQKLQYKRKNNDDSVIPQCNRNDEEQDENLQVPLVDQIQNPIVNDIDGDLENMMDLSEDMPCVIRESMKGSEVTEEGIVEMLRSMNEENEESCCDSTPLPPSDKTCKSSNESNKSHEKGDCRVEAGENSTNDCSDKSENEQVESLSCSSGVESSVGNSNYSILSLCISSKLSSQVPVTKVVTTSRESSKVKSSDIIANKISESNDLSVAVTSSSETLTTNENDTIEKSISATRTETVTSSASSIFDSNRLNSLKSDLSVSSLISFPVPHPENLNLKSVDGVSTLSEMPTTSSSLPLVPPTIFLHPPSFPTPPIPPLPLPSLSLPGLSTTHPSSTYSFSFSTTGSNTKSSSNNDAITATNTSTTTSTTVTATNNKNNNDNTTNNSDDNNSSNDAIKNNKDNKLHSETVVSSSGSTDSSNHNKAILDATSKNTKSNLSPIVICNEKQKSSDLRVSSSEIVSDCTSKFSYSSSVSVDQSCKLPVPFPLSSVPPSLPLLTTSSSESSHITKSILSLAPSISSYAHPFPFCALSLSDAPTTFSFTLTKTTSSTSSSQSQSSPSVVFVSKAYSSNYPKSVTEPSVSSLSETIMSTSVLIPSSSCKSSFASSLSIPSTSSSKVCASFSSTFTPSICSSFVHSPSSISAPSNLQSFPSRPNDCDGHLSVASLVASTPISNGSVSEGNNVVNDNAQDKLSLKTSSLDKDHFVSKANVSEKSSDSVEFKLPLLPLSTYMDSQESKTATTKHNTLLQSVSSNKKDDYTVHSNDNVSFHAQSSGQDTHHFKVSQLTRTYSSDNSIDNYSKSTSTSDEPQNKAINSLYVGTSLASGVENSNKEPTLNLDAISFSSNPLEFSKPDIFPKKNSSTTNESLKMKIFEPNNVKENNCQTHSQISSEKSNEFNSYTATSSVNNIIFSSASFSGDSNENSSTNSLTDSVISSKCRDVSKNCNSSGKSHSKDYTNLPSNPPDLLVKENSAHNIYNEKSSVDFVNLYPKGRKAADNENDTLRVSKVSLAPSTIESDLVSSHPPASQKSDESNVSSKTFENTGTTKTVTNESSDKEPQQKSGKENIQMFSKERSFHENCNSPQKKEEQNSKVSNESQNLKTNSGKTISQISESTSEVYNGSKNESCHKSEKRRENVSQPQIAISSDSRIFEEENNNNNNNNNQCFGHEASQGKQESVTSSQITNLCESNLKENKQAMYPKEQEFAPLELPLLSQQQQQQLQTDFSASQNRIQSNMKHCQGPAFTPLQELSPGSHIQNQQLNMQHHQQQYSLPNSHVMKSNGSSHSQALSSLPKESISLPGNHVQHNQHVPQPQQQQPQIHMQHQISKQQIQPSQQQQQQHHQPHHQHQNPPQMNQTQQQQHVPQLNPHLQTMSNFGTPTDEASNDRGTIKNQQQQQQQLLSHNSPMGNITPYVQPFDCNLYPRKISHSPRSDTRHQCHGYSKHLNQYQPEIPSESDMTSSQSLIPPPFLDNSEDITMRGLEEAPSDHVRYFSVSHLVSPYNEVRKQPVNQKEQNIVMNEEKVKESGKGKSGARKADSKSRGSASKGNPQTTDSRRRSPARSNAVQQTNNNISVSMWNAKNSVPKQGHNYSAEALISSQNYGRPVHRQPVNQNYHFMAPNQVYQSTYSSHQMKNFVQNTSFGYGAHDRSSVGNSDYNFQLHSQHSGSLSYGHNMPYMAPSYTYQNLPPSSSSVLSGDIMAHAHHAGSYPRLHDINTDPTNFAPNAAFLPLEPQDVCSGSNVSASAGLRASDQSFIIPPSSVSHARMGPSKSSAAVGATSSNTVNSSAKRSRYVDTNMVGSAVATPTNFLDGGTLSHIPLHSFTPPCEDPAIMHTNFLPGSSRHQSNFLFGSDNFMALNSSQHPVGSSNVCGNLSSMGGPSNNPVGINTSTNSVAVGPIANARSAPPVLPHANAEHVSPFNPLRIDRQQMNMAPPSSLPHLSSSLANFNLTSIIPEIDGKNEEATGNMSNVTSSSQPSVSHSHSNILPLEVTSQRPPPMTSSQYLTNNAFKSSRTTNSHTVGAPLVNNSINNILPSTQGSFGLNTSLALSSASSFAGISFPPSGS